MGWKASVIIINSDKAVNELELLDALGFGELKEIENEPFEVAMNPDDHQVYIGYYKGNLLLCAQEVPMTFLSETIAKGEKILTTYFPDTEICSIILHSVMNLWGYAVSINNQKIRVRAGSAEGGIMIEYGDPLEQELPLLAKSEIDEKGQKVYHLEDFPDEIIEEDQLGENFVFDVSGRYLGKNLDLSDALLFDTILKGYEFKNLPVTEKRKLEKSDPSKRWKQYLLIIAVILIWQLLKRTIFKD